MKPRAQLTVAIPTMRRWAGFLEKNLPRYLDNDLIDYVVICDETGEDAAALKKSPWAHHPKLRIHVNPKRLGMYYNKRQCMLESPTEWVAILDSDNIFPDAFFETIHDMWEIEAPDPNIIYAASEIVRVFLKTGVSEERTRHFTAMRIRKDNWNKVLKMPAWNFLLNDGNWIGHRSLLAAWPTHIPEKQIQATDSIRIVKQFVEAGKTYLVVPALRYIHTVHDDSEWIKTEAESSYLLATTNWTIQN